jgi:hypothetical protein
MSHLALNRFRAVLDLRKELRLNPDALVRDPLRIRLRLPNQRLQALLQLGGRGLVLAVVDLAGIDQLAALAAHYCSSPRALRPIRVIGAGHQFHFQFGLTLNVLKQCIAI